MFPQNREIFFLLSWPSDTVPQYFSLFTPPGGGSRVVTRFRGSLPLYRSTYGASPLVSLGLLSDHLGYSRPFLTTLLCYAV